MKESHNITIPVLLIEQSKKIPNSKQLYHTNQESKS